MLDFVVDVKEWKKTLKLLFSGRSRKSEDFADFHLEGDLLTIASTGTETEIPVQSATPGNARLPLKVLLKVEPLLTSFKKRELHVRVDAGQLRIESFNLTDRTIELRDRKRGPLDLPVNVSLLETLAAGLAYPADEIEASGLKARIAAARRTMEDAIDKAAGALKSLEIPRAAIAHLVNQQVAHRAKQFKSRPE